VIAHTSCLIMAKLMVQPIPQFRAGLNYQPVFGQLFHLRSCFFCYPWLSIQSWVLFVWDHYLIFVDYLLLFFFFGLGLLMFSFALYFWWMGFHPWIFFYRVFLLWTLILGMHLGALS
jgi:hypothetical protein